MRSIGRLLVLACLGTSVLIVASAPAYAYIDPGNGSYLLQLLLAGALSAAFVMKGYWRRMVAFLARLTGRRVAEGEQRDDAK